GPTLIVGPVFSACFNKSRTICSSSTPRGPPWPRIRSGGGHSAASMGSVRRARRAGRGGEPQRYARAEARRDCSQALEPVLSADAVDFERAVVVGRERLSREEGHHERPHTH